MNAIKKQLFLFQTETGFGVGAEQESTKTPVSVQYGDTSSSVDFDITSGNVKAENLSVPGDITGDGTITYDLLSDISTTGSIQPEYSTDNGNTWNTATSAGGDDGVNSLSVSSGGTSHTFIWDTVADLGDHFLGTVFFRIKAYDLANQGGDFETTARAKVQVDNAPGAPTNVSPTSGFFTKNETPTLKVQIPDPVEGNADMHVKLEIDPESTFDSRTDADGNEVAQNIFESRNDQNQWEYDSDGNGSWVQIPHSGIPVSSDATLIGNEVRFTIPTEDRLSVGHYFQRWSFGEVI